MATCVGRLKGLPPWRVAGLSGSPMVRRCLPSGVNFLTVCWRSSVSHTVPSASMVMPWARRTSPSPQERRNLPSRSKMMTGCSPRVKQKTLSLASTATPATSTKCQPSGSLPQPSIALKFMDYLSPRLGALVPAAARPPLISKFSSALVSGRSCLRQLGLPSSRKSILEGPVHALEATAQGLAGLLVGDDIESVGLDRAQHAPGHVFRREIPADELEPVVRLGATRVLKIHGPIPLARADIGGHTHGAEHRDADVVGTQILLKRLGEPDHRVLAGVVHAEALGGDEPGHGGGVDDVAGLLLRDHPRHEGLDAVDDAPEIDAQHPFT